MFAVQSLNFPISDCTANHLETGKNLAILFKSRDQIMRDQLSRTALDLMTLDHMNQLSILK